MTLSGRHWRPAYIGVGSNLDTPVQHVTRSFEELRTIAGCHLTAVSSLYSSAPLGPVEQPDFINAVAAMMTELPPETLLASLQEIEAAHGRDRDEQRWGPRTLDLDLLVCGAASISTETLTLPHPGIRERNFVLLPLCELAPHLEIPGLGTAAMLAADAADAGDCIKLTGTELT